MLAAHAVASVRAAERELMAALPPGALMARAATGLAHACVDELGGAYGRDVLLLVGTGDNGADALWAGAQLARRGARVTALCSGTPVADAAAALRAAGGRVGGPPPRTADLVVDGLTGIGGRGGLRPEAVAVWQAGLLTGAPVVAVDLPSGVDADTGAVAGSAVHADATVCFGTLKPGLLVGEGRRRAGRVRLVDLGLGPVLPPPDVEVLEAGDVATGVADDGQDTDKYRRGVVGVVAGSERYTGAAVLAVGAALAAGAGMVRFAGHPHAAAQVRARWPEAVVTEATGADVTAAGRVQAWVVGPGLGTDDVAAAAVEAVLAGGVPVLVDADALTVCAARPHLLRDRAAATVLTPHDREYARFGREVGDDRVGAARALAGDLGAHVLLKGVATVVAGPDGPARVNATGTPALATAGSGDVLAGGAGALLALLDDEPLLAASSAAHLHGLAGSLSAAGASTTAERVLAAWPDAVRAVRAATLPG